VACTLAQHALALIQAGAFVKKGLSSISEYPDLFKTQRRRLMQSAPKQSASPYGNLLATFEISAKYLESSSGTKCKDALDLLAFLAHIHHDRIPLSLFTRAWDYSQLVKTSGALLDDGEPQDLTISAWNVDNYPRFLRALPSVMSTGATLDSLSFQEAREALFSLSLINIDRKSGLMSVHPLIHK